MLNTLGNYYSSINRFSDAAEQYNASLSIDETFEPAIKNLQFFTSTRDSEQLESQEDDGSTKVCPLIDVSPDLEAIGFFDIQQLMGYSPFKMDTRLLKVIPSLKYYTNIP